MDERTARFGRLFEACYQPLHAYARRRMSAADADDLAADVLTSAWRRLDDIPVGKELPWLYGVARRTLANHRRGSVRRVRLLTRVAHDRTAEAPAPSVDTTLLEALARLRRADEEILRLAAWEQLGASDIAVVLGCTPNAAALRLSRARGRLRRELTGTVASRTPEERKVTDA